MAGLSSASKREQEEMGRWIAVQTRRINDILSTPAQTVAAYWCSTGAELMLCHSDSLRTTEAQSSDPQDAFPIRVFEICSTISDGSCICVFQINATFTKVQIVSYIYWNILVCHLSDITCSPPLETAEHHHPECRLFSVRHGTYSFFPHEARLSSELSYAAISFQSKQVSCESGC